MKNPRMLFCVPLVAITLSLTGCVAGQNIRLHYEPAASDNVVSKQTVNVVVSDQREFVTSGNKTPWYIGHYRAGFGNTWDVVNYGKVPLADQMKKDIQSELLSLGFHGNSQNIPSKTVSVSVKNWNFDAMANGELWYDITIVVIDSNGAALASTNLSDKKYIDGNFWTGAKGAMENVVPKIYADLIKSMIRDNPVVLAALKAG